MKRLMRDSSERFLITTPSGQEFVVYHPDAIYHTKETWSKLWPRPCAASQLVKSCHAVRCIGVFLPQTGELIDYD